MGFLEVVQGIVRGEGAVPSRIPDWVDIERCKRVLWESLAELPERRQAEAHREWAASGVLAEFVAVVTTDLSAGLFTSKRKRTLLDAVVRTAVVGRPPKSGLTSLEVLEVARIVELVAKVWRPGPGVEERERAVRWARGMGFLSPTGETPLGRAFARLRGRSALHFALEVGVMTSLGPEDDVRLGRGVIGDVLHRVGVEPDDLSDVYLMAVEVGIAVVAEVGPEVFDLAPVPELEDLLRAVLSEEPTPIRALAAALVQAEVGEVHAVVTAAPPATSDSGYSRLVLHELNNALLPLGASVNRLWSTLAKPGAPDPTELAALRERIARQIGRLQRFADESGRLLEATAPETFPLAALVEEAERETETERNGRIRVEADAISGVLLEGVRGRWLFCFVNLFRNAAQARAGKGVIRVSSEWDSAGRAHIYVDDDGPGIPEELRERIFDQGVSLRGGTGLGLSEARATVRGAGGTMACEASPSGGARFHIAVPARRQS